MSNVCEFLDLQRAVIEQLDYNPEGVDRDRRSCLFPMVTQGYSILGLYLRPFCLAQAPYPLENTARLIVS